MSKKRSSKKHPPKRGLHTTANRSTPPRLLKAPRIPVLRKIEDFRIKSFPLASARGYRLMDLNPVKPISTPFKTLYPKIVPLNRIADALPRDAIVCLKRSIRREIMFATGRGGSRKKQKPHRRNETSKIHCRKK